MREYYFESFFILTIKLNRAVCVTKGILANATIWTEIILANRINCELHDDFITIFHVDWLVSLAFEWVEEKEKENLWISCNMNRTVNKNNGLSEIESWKLLNASTLERKSDDRTHILLSETKLTCCLSWKYLNLFFGSLKNQTLLASNEIVDSVISTNRSKWLLKI